MLSSNIGNFVNSVKSEYGIQKSKNRNNIVDKCFDALSYDGEVFI